MAVSTARCRSCERNAARCAYRSSSTGLRGAGSRPSRSVPAAFYRPHAADHLMTVVIRYLASPPPDLVHRGQPLDHRSNVPRVEIAVGSTAGISAAAAKPRARPAADEARARRRRSEPGERGEVTTTATAIGAGLVTRPLRPSHRTRSPHPNGSRSGVVPPGRGPMRRPHRAGRGHGRHGPRARSARREFAVPRGPGRVPGTDTLAVEEQELRPYRRSPANRSLLRSVLFRGAVKRLDTPRNGQRIGTCSSRSSFKLVGSHPRSGPTLGYVRSVVPPAEHPLCPGCTSARADDLPDRACRRRARWRRSDKQLPGSRRRRTRICAPPHGLHLADALHCNATRKFYHVEVDSIWSVNALRRDPVLVGHRAGRVRDGRCGTTRVHHAGVDQAVASCVGLPNRRGVLGA